MSDSSVRPPGAAHTLCVLRKSYLLHEKTADQVVSSLKAEDLSYKSSVSFLEKELKTGW